MPIPAAFDLSGRVAVVTGAGSPGGIGFATARLLAELGAAVMISATTARIHDRVTDLRGAGFDAAGIAGDLTDPGVASGLVSAALNQWGRLDIVVNNAGMISTAVPVFESGTVAAMDLPTWQAALARNLTTAFLVSKAALPSMTSRGWGRIIMVASLTGPVMAIRADVGYATAKAGLIGLTRSVARELARRSITCNVVAPGPIVTEMTAEMPDDWRAQVQTAVPLGRLGTAEECAAVVGFLCSDAAAYITGAVVPVDGGLGMGH